MGFRSFMGFGPGSRRLAWRFTVMGVFGLAFVGAAGASSPSYDGPRLRSLAYVASNPEVVFAAGDGVFRSTDGGANWVALGPHLGYDQVLTDPHDARRVIAFQSLYAHHAGRYLESVDEGVTWAERSISGASPPGSDPPKGTSLDGFVMHRSLAGVWVALVEGKLWKTSNNGTTWEVRPTPSPVPMRGRIVATREAFYVASSTEVWRSSDGVDWHPTGLSNGEKLDQIALAGDAVVARTNQGWLQLAPTGAWERVTMLSAYERRYADQPKLPHGRIGRPDYCYPRQSSATASYLFATCSNNNMPPTVAIDYGIQQHSVDGGRTWMQIGGVGLPNAWFPTAVALHPRDPATLLMAWVTGRVFRSKDQGATWQASDAGLAFPTALRHLPEYGLPYLKETRLNQAVLVNDVDLVKRMAAEGVDLNATGAHGKTAVEWALIVGADSPRGRDAMYWTLRDLGAAVPMQTDATTREVFSVVARAGLSHVVEDMLRSGWNLAAVGSEGGPSALMRAIGRRCDTVDRVATAPPCRVTLAGKPLDHWIDRHLSSAQPGQSAQLALDLAELGELPLAERVVSFDAGRYRNAQDVLRLLMNLPPDAHAIRSQVFGSYKGRYGQISSNGDIYSVLIKDMKKPEWVLDVLPSDKGPINAENATLLVQVLLRDLKQPDWVKKMLRKTDGPRIDAEGREAIAADIVSSCDLAFLTAALGAGVRLNHSVAEFGWSTMRYALWSCHNRSPDVVDGFIARLHRAGLRLPASEWGTLKQDDLSALRRSSLGNYYDKAFEGQTAGVGIRLREKGSREYPEIDHVIPGLPAAAAGLEHGDLITAVDGVQTKAMSLENASFRIRGKPETKVVLTVLRKDGRTVVLSLSRQLLQFFDEPAPVEK